MHSRAEHGAASGAIVSSNDRRLECSSAATASALLEYAYLGHAGVLAASRQNQASARAGRHGRIAGRAA
jgi:hypothetical protein